MNDCYSFMKLSCADSKELRPFCCMVNLSRTQLANARFRPRLAWIIFIRSCNLKVNFKTVLTAAASRCYSFMKSSWADAKELRPFCYMALCYTRIEDARDRYSMFFIQPQKLFLSFLISREDVFLWKQKEQTGS